MDFSPQENCPLIIPKYFENVHPLGGHNASLIEYKEKPSETNEKCIQTCCLDSNCSAVFMMIDNSTLKCYHVSFKNSKVDDLSMIHSALGTLQIEKSSKIWGKNEGQTLLVLP